MRTKKIFSLLTCFVLFFISIGVLTACGKKASVSFMVQESNETWKTYHEAKVVDGMVEMPTNPTKEYYNFSNWYYAKDGSGDPFTNKDIKEDVTVYAKFVPIEVEVVINGENLGTRNLIDVVNGSYNPGEDLEFDGWYTNSNYSTKWNGKDVVNTLYAHSVALVTFNNGYEDVYSVMIKPNSLLESPKTSGKELTEIKQDYMSKYDIAYFDASGEVFDFSQAITKNTTINVKWRSPFLKYKINEITGHLTVDMYTKETYDDTETSATIDSVPVISIPGELTFDNDKDGVVESYKVDEINLNNTLLKGSALDKLIIGEGISIIQGLNAPEACTLKEVILPSTLKVIINSFNNLNSLESITLPEGVEVIIGSFFGKCSPSHSYLTNFLNTGEAYNFDIKVPNSVKNLSMIPSNFVFDKNKNNATKGDFYRDGDFVYKVDDSLEHEGKLLLIADFRSSSDTLLVPNVDGIQVGTYFNRQYENLILPSTFSYVGYNAKVSDYEGLTSTITDYYSSLLLWDEQYVNDVRGKISPAGIAISNKLDSFENLVFNGAPLEGDITKYAFLGDPSGWGSMMESMLESYTAQNYKDVVVYLAETDTPKVIVTFVDILTGEIYEVEILKNKNETLLFEEILAAVDSKYQTSYEEKYAVDNKLELVSVTSFGLDYDLNNQITTNLYLIVEADYINIAGGYTAEKNSNGEAIITGFDQNSAEQMNDGSYIVCIPDEVTIDGEKLTVTEIKANAFDATINPKNISIGAVKIPATVKTIGDRAFYMCEGLLSVQIVAGGLENIGASAFEGTSITTIALPLANLKSIGEYAFKIETLKEFVPASGEENRNMLNKADLAEGEFFIKKDIIGVNGFSPINGGYGIYQYVGKETVEGVTTWDVKFIASAGFANAQDMMIINLGDVTDQKNVIRYEVMEGSIYFVNGGSSVTISLNYVSKIHSNAFTNCATKNINFCYTDLITSQRYRNLNDFVLGVENIFENEWYQGYTADGLGNLGISKI